MSKKYNEYRVLIMENGKIIKKEPTERGFVMISKFDAEEMNADVDKTKLFYELAKQTK